MCFTGLLSELSSYVFVNAEVVITSIGTWHLIHHFPPLFWEIDLIKMIFLCTNM